MSALFHAVGLIFRFYSAYYFSAAFYIDNLLMIYKGKLF